MNWIAVKEAAMSESERALRQNDVNLDDTQNALVNLNKEYEGHIKKGLTTARVTGATIPPAAYMLVQYLRGKKINPWVAGGLSFGGMLAGDLGRYKWNQHTWDKAKGEPFEKTQDNAIKAYQSAIDAKNKDIEESRKLLAPQQASKGASEVNLVEKIARDVSGRYDEMLKRNADFLKKQRLAKRTVEVFTPDGTPGRMHGVEVK